MGIIVPCIVAVFVKRLRTIRVDDWTVEFPINSVNYYH